MSKGIARLDDVRARRTLQRQSGAQHVVVGFRACGQTSTRRCSISATRIASTGNLAGDLILQSKEISERLVVTPDKHGAI